MRIKIVFWKGWLVQIACCLASGLVVLAAVHRNPDVQKVLKSRLITRQLVSDSISTFVNIASERFPPPYSKGSALKYRAEIDGLRAVAIVPVILFHAGIELFSGGFVGVDVFFVISGYLITTIISDELQRGTFSLQQFYKRRARRILPALVVMVGLCIPFAFLLLPPENFKNFCHSIMAVATFSSNILFWQEIGYFNAAAELKPLLHTWSLAVEEQYYILFPLLISFTFKRGAYWTVVVFALLFVASLSLAQWGAFNLPGATFFLLVTRAWELLVGAFTALYLHKNAPLNSVRLNNIFALLGLILILVSVFAFDDTTPFPGLYALVPTLGTALIILCAREQTLVRTILKAKFFVLTGLLSYSLYLWHQPLLVFMRFATPDFPGSNEVATALLLTLILAALSYRFVEVPFRKVLALKTITAAAGVSILLMLVSGFMLPALYTRTYAASEIYAEALISQKRNERFTTTLQICEEKGKEACNDAVPGKQNILIIGDSHSIDALNLLAAMLDPDAVSFSLFSQGGCPPHPAIRTITSRTHPDLVECEALNRKSFDPERLKQYDVIVLSVLLGWYSEDHYGNYVNWLKANYAGKVIVSGSTFAFKSDLPVLRNQGVRVRNLERYLEFDPRLKEAELKALVESNGYLFLSKQAVFCPRSRCEFVAADGDLITYDHHHLSMYAVDLLVNAYKDNISRYLSR